MIFLWAEYHDWTGTQKWNKNERITKTLAELYLSVCVYIFKYIYIYTVSHKSEYTPHISAKILV